MSPTEFIFSGEPLPLAPPLGSSHEVDVVELTVFHNKLLDYLRRLTAKLSSVIYTPDVDVVDPVTAVTDIESIFLTLSADFDLATDPDIIEWDQVQRLDDPFTYSVSTGIITIVEEGFYLLIVSAYLPGIDPHRFEIKDGNGTRLPYANFYYDEGIAAVKSETFMVPITVVTADAPMDIRIEVVGGGANEAVEAIGSRLIMMKLGSSIGSGGVDPCDFDVWQLCP